MSHFALGYLEDKKQPEFFFHAIPVSLGKYAAGAYMPIYCGAQKDRARQGEYLMKIVSFKEAPACNMNEYGFML